MIIILLCTSNCRFLKLENKIVVFNSLIGGAFVLSNNSLKFLNLDEQNGRIVGICEDMPIEIIEIFSKNGMLQNDNCDKNMLNTKLSGFYQAVENGELITNIRLTLTKACNCRCCYCFVDKSDCAKPLTCEECIDFVSKIVAATNYKKYNLRFFGGEPTLEFGLIEKVVNHLNENFKDVSFSYLLNTNAQCITDEMRLFLKKNNFKTVISLDSDKAQNDKQRVSIVNGSYYDAALEQIKHFVEDEMHFVVGSVLTNDNLDGLSDFLNTMKRIGVKSIGLNHAKMVEEDIAKLDEKFADKIFSAYKFGMENGIHVSGYWFLPFNRLIQGAPIGFCGGLGHEFDLRPDRKIYSCVASPIEIGDINDSFKEIISSKNYVDIAKRVVTRIEDCAGCELEGACAGDCAWDAYYRNNTIYSVNTKICDFQKYLTRKLIEYTFSED